MTEDPRKAAVIAVGDELLAGDLSDGNSGVIARALLELGIETDRFLVVGDDRASLERAFVEHCNDYQIVVVTGGLGPTLDDVTREAAAAAAGVPLERSPQALERIRAIFAARGRAFAESNERQAWFPAGAQVMPNAWGTAPGFRVWVQGGMLAALPGPPAEMRAMLEAELIPYLASTCGRGERFERAHFYLVGLPESTFADLAGDWMERSALPRMGVTADHGVLSVSLRARASSEAGVRAQLDPRCAAFRERFGEWIFSEQDPDLAHAVGRTLIERGLTVATAESCTGGLVAELLTSVPGVSAVFLEGWTTYSNEAKAHSLGVPAELIRERGAVSGEVAAAMAAGAAASSGARLAVSTTGIAGPEGGTAEKPVGTVFVGLCVDGRASAEELRLPDIGRAGVRRLAAHRALDLLRRNLPAS